MGRLGHLSDIIYHQRGDLSIHYGQRRKVWWTRQFSHEVDQQQERLTNIYENILRQMCWNSRRRISGSRALFKSGLAIIRHYARARDGDYGWFIIFQSSTHHMTPQGAASVLQSCFKKMYRKIKHFFCKSLKIVSSIWFLWNVIGKYYFKKSCSKYSQIVNQNAKLPAVIRYVQEVNYCLTVKTSSLGGSAIIMASWLIFI